MVVVSYIIGVLCILYCLVIGLFIAHGTNFFLMWGVVGIVFIAFGALWKGGVLFRLPMWIKVLSTGAVGVGIILFLVIEGLIVNSFFMKETKQLDYLVVLGAQLKESGPSRVLQLRLDKAYDYLIEHPDTKVIVSGGQGANEPDTEAEGMYQYLVKKGISPERIIKEDKSRNTSENINFSSEFFEKESQRIGIVTNNFHVFRAVGLAKYAGYQDVCGIPAPSEWYMLPNNMFREFFGVVKDFFVGNLR